MRFFVTKRKHIVSRGIDFHYNEPCTPSIVSILKIPIRATYNVLVYTLIVLPLSSVKFRGHLWSIHWGLHAQSSPQFISTGSQIMKYPEAYHIHRWYPWKRLTVVLETIRATSTILKMPPRRDQERVTSACTGERHGQSDKNTEYGWTTDHISSEWRCKFWKCDFITMVQIFGRFCNEIDVRRLHTLCYTDMHTHLPLSYSFQLRPHNPSRIFIRLNICRYIAMYQIDLWGRKF